jgi:hypothetical protein
MNNKHIYQWQYLLPIAIGAVFGMFFNPMAARAFSLVSNTANTCPSSLPAPTRFFVRLDTSDKRPICIFDNRSGDSNSKPNQIGFSRQDGALNVSGLLVRQRIRSLRFLRDPGVQVNGSLLVLTKLKVKNTNHTSIQLGNGGQPSNNSFIFFQDFFQFKAPGFGRLRLKGSFTNISQFSPRGRNSSVTLTGSAYRIHLSSLTATNATRNNFDLPSYSKTITRNKVVGNSIAGDLNRLTLEGDKQLNLPNSACIVVLDKQVTDRDVEQLCDRAASVPEPSATITILTLGVLGSGFLLKRRRK